MTRTLAEQVSGDVLKVTPLDHKLTGTVVQALDRWPSAGLAVAIVRGESLEWFHGYGVADVETREPITPETVFRIASITKTFTAIAVMQLWEEGLIDLDAPAADYLRTLHLRPAKAEFRPVTVRHLLTHTAGIGYWRRLSDLLQPGVGSGDRAGPAGAAPVTDYYRKGLLVEVEPGTKWMYTNHGIQVLGQIVEDVTGRPLDSYLRDRVFVPLGMHDTDLVPTDRIRARLATGYVLRSRGLKAVADREVPTPAASGAYSTAADLARYVAALLGHGTNEYGTVLRSETLATMFRPHFRPDPRLPGMGLAFHLDDVDGHRTAGHGGILSGFLSAILLAPDDGVGVIALRNTGGLDARGTPEPLATALVRNVLGLRSGSIRTDIPPRPETWGELCGWYSPAPGPVTNMFIRATLGAGIEIVVHDQQLLLRPLTPIPSLRAGMRLYPDDPEDPRVFRADFSEYGFGPRPVAFVAGSGRGDPASALVMDEMVFHRRPGLRNPRRLMKGTLAAGATIAAGRLVRARRTT